MLTPNELVNPSAAIKRQTTAIKTTKTRPYCLSSSRSSLENNPQASMLRSMAAANATNAAASSEHFTCCAPTSTSGLLHLPAPSTVDDITNPGCTCGGRGPYPSSDPHPDPDREEGLEDQENDPDPKSQLLCGVCTGVVPTQEVMSMLNLPPFLELMEPAASVAVASESVRRWKR